MRKLLVKLFGNIWRINIWSKPIAKRPAWGVKSRVVIGDGAPIWPPNPNKT
jgi:hypothetical protein